MTTTADTAAEAGPAATGPAEAVPLHAVTPYLAVTDARAAVEFYVEAFGARRRGEPIVMPDGRTGHVEVALGDSVLMMADEFPEMGLVAPLNRGGVSQSLRLEVGDPDAVVERAVRLGGTLERPVTDSPYGRGGVVIDPAGHRWMISREPAGTAARTGPIVYASVWTHDVVRAERFYAAVLGWTVTAGSGAQGRQVANRQPRLGLFGGQRSTLMACYAVADVDAAVALVRAAGGTATDPVDEEHGRVADCVDDQGLPFALHAGAGGPAGPAADVTGTGALTYVSVHVPDEARARAFYGTVLGWRFFPGARPGTWHVRTDGADGPDAAPTIGLSGGHPASVAVPMFTVADIRTAARDVRAAGGTCTDPRPPATGPPPSAPTTRAPVSTWSSTDGSLAALTPPGAPRSAGADTAGAVAMTSGKASRPGR